MGLTPRTSGSAQADSSTTTLAVTVTVVAGDVVKIWNKYEGLPTTLSTSDGVDAALLGTHQSHSNNDLHGQWTYYLASRGGTLTLTTTWAAARPFKLMHVWVENPNGGTATLDTQSVSQGSSTALSSGTFNTSGTDESVHGGAGIYAAVIATSPLVNGAAADGSLIDSPAGTFAASWYKILAATFTGGAATLTKTGTDPWIAHALAIKVGAAAPAVVSPVLMPLAMRAGSRFNPKLRLQRLAPPVVTSTSTTYDDGTSDTLSATDSAASAMDAAGTVSESGTASDGQVVALVAEGLRTESLTALENATGALAADGPRAESLTAADSATGAWVASSTVSESLSSATSEGGTLAAGGTRAEALSASDAASGAMDSGVAASESLSASDSSSGGLALPVAQSESLTASDSALAGFAVGVSGSESLSASASETATLAASGTITETLTAADVPTATALMGAAAAETLSAVDASAGAATLPVARSESLTAADVQDATVAAPGSGTTYDVSASDALALSDSATGTLPSATVDTLPWLGEFEAPTTVAGEASDQLALRDSPAATLQAGARLADALPISDRAVARMETDATFSDRLSARDQAEATVVHAGAVSDELTLREYWSADHYGVRSVERAPDPWSGDEEALLLLAAYDLLADDP